MALTVEQHNTVKAVKELVFEGGKTPCHDTFVRAHRVGYSKLAGAKSSKVSAYVAKNLKSAAFLEALKPLAVESDHGE